MFTAHRAPAINIARDLCLKMLERRCLSPDNLPDALALLALTAENLLRETEDGRGLWLVRLARDLTVKLIERNLISSVQQAAENLADNCRMLAPLAACLEPQAAAAALAAARDLCLKLLETGRLSRANLPDFFQRLALSCGGRPGPEQEPA